eukprot:6257910-Prymnesium_polylepis.2
MIRWASRAARCTGPHAAAVAAIGGGGVGAERPSQGGGRERRSGPPPLASPPPLGCAHGQTLASLSATHSAASYGWHVAGLVDYLPRDRPERAFWLDGGAAQCVAVPVRRRMGCVMREVQAHAYAWGSACVVRAWGAAMLAGRRCAWCAAWWDGHTALGASTWSWTTLSAVCANTRDCRRRGPGREFNRSNGSARLCKEEATG